MGEQVHVALPNKYRPMTFDDVVGQEHVVRTLRHAIEAGRIANAYLFIGPRGIGKTTLSRIFAKALNCSSPKGVEPCGECVNCREIAAGNSLDVTELDAASHNGVDDVRPIIEQAQFKPATSKYKVYIIDECHMLSKPAWNALLKTLEEPPPHVRFIFATTEGDKVLATIVSRCQRFDLRRIQTNDIVARLKYICEKEKLEVDDDALLAIARGADGGMRDALSSLDQLVSFKEGRITEEDALGVFGLVSRAALENLAGAILRGDVAAILSAIEMFDSAGRNMRRISAELLMHFRNLVVLQALGPEAKSLEATPEQIAVLAEQAKGIDPGRVFKICDQLGEMEDKLRYVLSVRALIEMSLIKASRIATTATIDELMKAVRALRGGASASASAPAAPSTFASAPAAPSTIASARAAAPGVSAPARAGANGGAAGGASAMAHELPDVSALMSEMAAEAKPAPAPAAAPASAATPAPAPAPMTQSEMMDDPRLEENVLSAFPGASIADVHQPRKRK